MVPFYKLLDLLWHFGLLTSPSFLNLCPFLASLKLCSLPVFLLSESFFLIYVEYLSFPLYPWTLVWYPLLHFVSLLVGTHMVIRGVTILWPHRPPPPQVTGAGNGIWPKPGWWEPVPRNFGPGTEKNKPELELKGMSQHFVRYLDLSYKIENCQKLGLLLLSCGLRKHKKLVRREKRRERRQGGDKKQGLFNSSGSSNVPPPWFLGPLSFLIRASTSVNGQ